MGLAVCGGVPGTAAGGVGSEGAEFGAVSEKTGIRHIDDIPIPDKAPEPRPGSPMSPRFEVWMKENWRTCRPEFWRWQPNSRYQFRSHELSKMEALLTAEDLAAIRLGEEEGRRKSKICLDLRIPYAVVDKVVKTDINKPWRELGRDRDQGLGFRVDRLQNAVITEMEERIRDEKTRKALSAAELAQMVKTLVGVKKEIETSPDEGMSMRVISKMPKKAGLEEGEEDV